MNLRDFVRLLRKRWRLIATTVALAIAAGVAITLLTPTMYTASAQIFVSTSQAGTAQELAQGNTFTEARVQSYTAIATSEQVTQAVVDDLELPMTAAQLARKITADAPVNKVLINLSVSDRSASEAATLTNAVANQFKEVVVELETPEASVDPTTGAAVAAVSPIKLTVTLPATVPNSPTQPKTALYIALALVVGLFLGLVFAVLRELFDNTFKSLAELEKRTGLPVLGTVPLDRSIQSSTIAFHSDSHGSRSEAFRQLRTNLQFVAVDRPQRIFAVTSALPSEGKTHLAINLAAALAEAGQRVCLIEADLRKPTFAKVLGLVGEVGVTNVLLGNADVADVLQNAGANLAVMTSGPIPPNPSELLVTEQFSLMLAEIASKVDVVILDTAPLLPVADGAEVAVLADATLLAVRYGKTTRDQLERALERLRRVEVSPVGTVLSIAPLGKTDGYSYYYGGVSEPTPPARRRAATMIVEDTADAAAETLDPASASR